MLQSVNAIALFVPDRARTTAYLHQKWRKGLSFVIHKIYLNKISDISQNTGECGHKFHVNIFSGVHPI
jgi:hypothetical protein